MKSIGYIDLHCDTITMLNRARENLEHNRRMVKISHMKKGNTKVQCFAAFVPTGYYPLFMRKNAPWKRFLQIADKKDALLQFHQEDLVEIRSYTDIDYCKNAGKIGALFTIEDAGVFGEEMQRVKTAYERGVRIASLTWNHKNAIGYPHSRNSHRMEKGLTGFGLEVVEEMNRLGILIDVSHLSDGGFWDVAKYSAAPFVATHSNSRAVTHHSRNMTDTMIRKLAEKGGVMGLNFAPDFLSDRKDNTSTIEDMTRHILHIRQVGGSQILAIGSDFDGIHGKLEIGTPEKMPLLFHALHKAGLTENELEQMWQGNALRIFREVLR